MRLKNIYKTAEKALPVIASAASETISNTDNYKLKNWNTTLNIIYELRQIDIFEEDISKLINISPLFGDDKGELIISRSQHSSYVSWHKSIVEKLKTIIALCASLGYDDAPIGFEIKMPETKSFDDFADCVEGFARVLKFCPFLRDENSDIKMQKTDIGSTWIVFTIIGSAAMAILTAVGHVAQSALKIKSMYLTCEQQKQDVRAASQKADLATRITDLYDEMIKTAASCQVEKLEKELDKKLDHEEKNNAQMTLDSLGKLMSQGLEIYATLEAPKEARDIFPSIEAQKLISSPKKLLTESVED